MSTITYKLFCIFIIFLFHLICAAEKIIYFEVQHPSVDYYNPKFLKYANLTSHRYGRANPIYYVGLHFEPLVNFDETILVDMYFYELLTNQYKRSFIEMHYDWCSLTLKDMLFGSSLRKAGLTKPCPHEPGPYNLVNMTINPRYIPPGFPFTRGRIYANFTHTKTKAIVAEGHIDMRLSTMKAKDLKLFE